MTDLRLGWRPEPPDPRTLKLANYLTPALPTPPKKVDWLSRVTTWPTLGNDRIGDCTVASCGHQILAWTAYASDAPVNVGTDSVIAAYSAISGYEPATGANDNGARSTDALNYWRKVGIGGHRIGAYVAVDLRNHAEVRTALWLFGGLIIAGDLPLDAQSQFRQRRVWRPTTGASGRPGSWGGHQMRLSAAGSRYLDVVTWGREQRLTWGWLDRYMSDGFAVVAPEWLSTTGLSPTGLDMPALLADLRAVTA